MFKYFIVLLCLIVYQCETKLYHRLNNLISCHTTDYVCFKKQFQGFRDNYLLGSDVLGIDTHQPLVFGYGDSATCVKVTGIESCELAGISIGVTPKGTELSLTLNMPIRLQQTNDTGKDGCGRTEYFDTSNYVRGNLYEFSGNATIQLTFPYVLRKRKSKTHLELMQEDLEMVLDLPDLSYYQGGDSYEEKMYQASEWAYDIFQNLNPAADIGLPFSARIKRFMSRVPLDYYLMLYPEERYDNLNFSYREDTFRNEICQRINATGVQ